MPNEEHEIAVRPEYCFYRAILLITSINRKPTDLAPRVRAVIGVRHVEAVTLSGRIEQRGGATPVESQGALVFVEARTVDDLRASIKAVREAATKGGTEFVLMNPMDNW